MTRKKLLKILKKNLSQKMQEVSIQSRRYLALAPQKCKVDRLNYETSILPSLIKIIVNGYEDALNEGVIVLSNHLRFSWQKKPFLKLYLDVAEQQTEHIYHIISEDKHFALLSESSKCIINIVSKNLISLTNHKLDTIVLRSCTYIEIVSVVLSIISISLTVLFGIISLI